MSFDDDYGSSNGYAVVLIAIVLILGVICLEIVILGHSGVFDTTAQKKQRQTLANQTKLELDSSTITCNDISKLRVASIHANASYADPFNDGTLLDNARDLWNAKGCGAHWGWFER